MSAENVEIIQTSFAYFAETGERQWAVVDDDVEVHDHDILDAAEYRGHAGYARWIENWGAAWSEFSIEPQEFIEADERVVVVLRMKATGRGSGVALEREDAMVFEMRAGKVARIDYYNNRAQALRAVGLE